MPLIGSVYITVETQDSVELFWQQMETVLDHLLHTLFLVRLKHWQVATDTTHKINLFVFSFLICTADCAYMYCLFSPIPSDGTTSGTTRNVLGSNVS